MWITNKLESRQFVMCFSSVLRLDQPNYYAYFLFEGKHLFNVHET